MTDNLYWDSFYKKKIITTDPSNFCTTILDFFKDHKNLNILDAGCGNGRDSYALATKHNVVGIDICNNKNKDIDNCKFEIADFCNYNKTNFNLVYSRFTFHSITNEKHNEFLKSINKHCYLCIEARSDKDKDSYRFFGNEHYRNFINLDYLKTILKKNNFKILLLEEKNDVAIYKNENPICIRVICIKE